MKLGLGTGSTAAWMVRCLAERVREEGLKVTCVRNLDPHGGPWRATWVDGCRPG
jgi:hypothetical protein